MKREPVLGPERVVVGRAVGGRRFGRFDVTEAVRVGLRAGRVQGAVLRVVDVLAARIGRDLDDLLWRGLEEARRELLEGDRPHRS